MAGLLLVGASGLARELIAAGISGVVGILDDDETLWGTDVDGVPVRGGTATARRRSERLLVCVGQGAARAAIVAQLRGWGVTDERFATYIAPSARLGTTSTVGRGSIVLDGVVVTAHARIGRHVVVMPNCTITHDDVIEDAATLAAGVALGGGVRVGAQAYIGMNAAVRQGSRIGAGATVGMSAAVLGDVPAGETWVGVPARPMGARTRDAVVTGVREERV
ncbi:NeuD/PglB/VioB family sugar acetyltransferase [Microbacterium sp. W1N]|nr:NeuD/PglB/VioB family sugar acetyltransferase [Microbacterium festucae]